MLLSLVLLHPGRSKNRWSQHLDSIFRHQLLHRAFILFVHRHASNLVKKLLKSAGLAHQDQLALSRGCVRPNVRNATGQPDTPTRQKTELFAARPKDEFTRKNVIPLVFAMMNMQEWAVILATGSYLGEGFDDPRLDTLLLAMPISWKGTLQQYVGRLHRLHDNKSEVHVYDYADVMVPMLARMYKKRLAGYAALGYTVADVVRN
jgi:hypothetical protein